MRARSVPGETWIGPPAGVPTDEHLADGIFDYVAGRLEDSTSLESLEARGTLRIALKEAGLDAKSVLVAQMSVVLKRVMPLELEARGVPDAIRICARIADDIEAEADRWVDDTGNAPEDVFRRLGGRND